MFHRYFVPRRSDVFVLAIDVDLTMVDSLTPWLNWCGERVSRPLSIFDIPEPMVDEAIDIAPWLEESICVSDPLFFWRSADLYDNMKPNESFLMFVRNLENAIEDMSGKQVQKVIVSSCFPEHEASKRRLVERAFGKEVPFISTNAKHLVDFDVIIDDNLGVTFNCLEAGKAVVMAPSPLTRPSRGLKLNPNLFCLSGESGASVTWPANWNAFGAYAIAEELVALKDSNK